MVGNGSGRILFESGYYRDLGTFLYLSTPIQRVSSAPSAAEVRRARDILEEPLQDLPLVNSAARATAMAVMVTPFARQLIEGPTPAHHIEKPTPGTGASLLTDVLLTPAVGTGVQKLTPPSSEHE
jgi:putative DNA primase/helicase